MRNGLRIALTGACVFLASPVMAQNLLQNPGLDSDLENWVVERDRISVDWNATDIDGSANSGSALIVHDGDNLSIRVLSQCAQVEGGFDYSFGGNVLVSETSSDLDSVTLLVYSYAEGACFGSSLSSGAASLNGSGPWREFSGVISVPEGANGVDFRFLVGKVEEGQVTVNADDFWLLSTEIVYEDGFESQP